MKESNCANRTEYNVKPRNKKQCSDCVLGKLLWFGILWRTENTLDEERKKNAHREARTWQSRAASPCTRLSFNFDYNLRTSNQTINYDQIYILGLVTHAATAPECQKHACERVARGSSIENYISQYSYVCFVSFGFFRPFLCHARLVQSDYKPWF